MYRVGLVPPINYSNVIITFSYKESDFKIVRVKSQE